MRSISTVNFRINLYFNVNNVKNSKFNLPLLRNETIFKREYYIVKIRCECMSKSSEDYFEKIVSIKDILLDLENPRYHEKLIQTGKNKWTDKMLQEIIEEEDISDILPSIKASGIREPIWVFEKGQNRKFEVLEGSRRLVVLRGLIRDNVKPAKNISYDKIKCQVYPKNTDPRVIDAQRVILQTGKKTWGPFNEASAIYKLVHNDRYSTDEVAKMMRSSVVSINKELENYKHYIDFTKFIKKRKIQGIEDPRKYLYFQRAGAYVRDRFFNTTKEKEKFFKLITPNKDGETRIRSVSLKGGLYDFNKFAQNEIILQKFLKNERMTVDEALDNYRGTSINDSMPWIKKLSDVAKGINNIDGVELEKLKKESIIMKQIKRIYLGSKSIIESTK